MLWTMQFWKGAAERALKSFAQALVVFVGAAGVGVLEIDWPTALGVSAAVGLASVLTSVGNADFVAGPPDGIHPFHVVMDAPLGEVTKTKDLDRDYTMKTGPAWDAVEQPAAEPTEKPTLPSYADRRRGSGA